jgi:hypothetical protein
MAKKKVSAKQNSKAKKVAKKSIYRPETLGIKFDSLTFLIFCVFVLVCAVWLVSKMMGLNLF